MNAPRGIASAGAGIIRAGIASACLLIAAATGRVHDGLPRVLVIGDHGWGERSPPGSNGYTEAVAAKLAGRAHVERSPESGATTVKAVTRLDAWLGTTRWDVIHFSFGLHDVKRDDTGQPAVSLEEFERNLETIVDRLQATGAAIVWASATPVPEGKRRRPADIGRYNAAARRVMDRRGIPTNDLYATAMPHLAEWQIRGSPHFNATGAAGLATHVAEAIETALAGRDDRNNTSPAREPLNPEPPAAPDP